MAAQLGYTSPSDRHDKAVENTRRMFDLITGIEEQTKRNLGKKGS